MYVPREPQRQPNNLPFYEHGICRARFTMWRMGQLPRAPPIRPPQQGQRNWLVQNFFNVTITGYCRVDLTVIEFKMKRISVTLSLLKKTENVRTNSTVEFKYSWPAIAQNLWSSDGLCFRFMTDGPHQLLWPRAPHQSKSPGNMMYIWNCIRIQTRNLFRHKCTPIPSGHSDGYSIFDGMFLIEGNRLTRDSYIPPLRVKTWLLWGTVGRKFLHKMFSTEVRLEWMWPQYFDCFIRFDQTR